MRRKITNLRPRFSLRAVLVAVTLVAAGCAFGARWYGQYCDCLEARDRFYDAEAEWSVRLITWRDYYTASKTYMNAALAVPFCDREAALHRHLDLVVYLEQCQIHSCYMPRTENDVRDHEHAIEQLAGYRRQMEARLAGVANRS